MGTTFVCLVIAGNKGVIGHVGDSRVYLVRNGQCAPPHRGPHPDRRAAQGGHASPRSRRQTSQYRNVITRAVGIQESVQVDTLIVDLLPGDLFLLCSRRAARLPDRRGGGAARRPRRAGGSCPRSSSTLANERGGKDNITAVVVGVVGDGRRRSRGAGRGRSRGWRRCRRSRSSGTSPTRSRPRCSPSPRPAPSPAGGRSSPRGSPATSCSS